MVKVEPLGIRWRNTASQDPDQPKIATLTTLPCVFEFVFVSYNAKTTPGISTLALHDGFRSPPAKNRNFNPPVLGVLVYFRDQKIKNGPRIVNPGARKG